MNREQSVLNFTCRYFQEKQEIRSVEVHQHPSVKESKATPQTKEILLESLRVHMKICEASRQGHFICIQMLLHLN